MHPIIAFLSFIFSPADDWLLKQAFELFIDPSRIPAAVESYDRIEQQYPSLVNESEQNPISADTVATALWADILRSHGKHREALVLLNRLDKDPQLSPELASDIKLRIGESSLNQGDFETAATFFNQILEDKDNPRSLDAQIDLLICDLAQNNKTGAADRAEKLLAAIGPDVHLSRGLFPLGLTAFVTEQYDQSVKYLSMMEEDPRSAYFLGLSYRHLNKPFEALAQWQRLRKFNADPFWSNLANFQIAETYFALGDDSLSKVACEQALKSSPPEKLSDQLQFRLATIDIRSKNFESAVARLTPLIENKDLSDRTTVLLAESLIKTGRSKDLVQMLARENKKDSSAMSTYQTAWASLYEKDHGRALAIAEQGLEDFFDQDYTPRLLLLQGLAFEHLGKEAEALATFQTIIDRFPNTAAAAHSIHWTLLAYMRANRWKEAVTHGSYAWNQFSEETKRVSPDTSFWLAEAQLRLKNFDESEKEFSNFLTLARKDHNLTPYAQFQRSVALAKLNRPGEALLALQDFSLTAKERNKLEWVSLAHLQKGHIHFNEKEYALAVASYRTTDKSPKSLFQEGLALHRMDYFSDAIDTWTKLAQQFPQDPLSEVATFRSARTQFELGLATQAVVAFNKFIETYPNSPFVKEARLQSAHALFNAGDIVSAAPIYADYLARYNSSGDLASVTPYLASCYAQLGKSAQEAGTLLKGLPPTEALASLEWNQGAKDYNEKKYDEANALFSSVLTRYPSHENSATALFYRGESLFLQNKWAEAENAFRNYLSLYKENNQEHAPMALFHQAVAVYNQDRLLNAGELFKAFMEKFPEDKLAADARENLYLCYYNLGDWTTAEMLKKKYSAIVVTNNHNDKKLANSELDWIAE